MLNNLKIAHPAQLVAIEEKPNNEELVQFFAESCPSLVNEIITCLIAAATKEASNLQASIDSNESALSAQTHSTSVVQQQPVNNKPDVFFKDIKCFKCGKFGTKLKQSLFQHLHAVHGYDVKLMEREYDQVIQNQLQVSAFFFILYKLTY